MSGITRFNMKPGTLTTSELSSSAGITDGQLANGALYIKSDGSVAMGANLPMGANKITGMANGTASTDGATVGQLSSALIGIASNFDVRTAVTGNISISAPGTSNDGVTYASGDPIFLAGQTTQTQNGPWIWNGGSSALTRPAGFPNAGSIKVGTVFVVAEGTVGKGNLWMLTQPTSSTATSLVIGTDNLTFTLTNPLTSLSAGNNAISVTGGSISGVVNSAGGIQIGGSGLELKLADSTLVAGASGVKLMGLASGHLFVGNGSGVAADVAPSGAVTAISTAGAFTLDTSVSTGFMKYTAVTFFDFSASLNGSTTSFTLPSTPANGKVFAFSNGDKLVATNNYTVTGTTFALANVGTAPVGAIPVSGDTLEGFYFT